MKPTIGHELRKSQEIPPNTESSRIFVEKADQRFREECTFQPQINQSSKEFSREERWKKLTEPNRDKIRQRDQMRA